MPMTPTTTEEHAKRTMRRTMDTTRAAANMQSVGTHIQRTSSENTDASGVVLRACEAPQPVFLLRNYSVSNVASELTLDFARFRPQQSLAETVSRPPTTAAAFHTSSMIITLPDFPAATFLPMDASTNDVSSALPSLKEALRIHRTLGGGAIPADDSISHATLLQMPTTTLSASDWEEILQSCGGTEEYVSPDVPLCFENQYTLQGSQELDIGGREFLDSPAIPVIGSVPRTFGDILVPVRLREVAAPLDPPPKRYALREKPRPSQIFPPFHSLTLAAEQASGALRPLSLKAKHGGKSARTRLFASPTAEGQENEPQNVMKPVGTSKKRLVPPKLVNKPVVTKSQPRERRSLDSATPEPVQPRAEMVSRSNRKTKDCLVLGCTKNARSKGLCKRHGGGKRCSVDGCSRSDQGGGRCISHGGGRRCAVEECKNSAQSRGLCKSHGGGKRCTAPGCVKSCQGGGLCREHGGVRLCKEPVCFNYRHSSGVCRSHAHSPPHETAE